MATVRVIQSPPELACATERSLSVDGKTVACRAEGDKPGLYAFDVGGAVRSLKLDTAAARYHSPTFATSGDLMFRVAVDKAAPRVGAVPAFGRGSPAEWEGLGIALSDDGRVLAILGPDGRTLSAAVVEAGNSPFGAVLKPVAVIDEATQAAEPARLEVTRDGGWLLVVREHPSGAPSLWSFPVGGGDAQELVPQVPPPAFLSFALSESQLAVLENPARAAADLPALRAAARRGLAGHHSARAGAGPDVRAAGAPDAAAGFLPGRQAAGGAGDGRPGAARRLLERRDGARPGPHGGRPARAGHAGARPARQRKVPRVGRGGGRRRRPRVGRLGRHIR